MQVLKIADLKPGHHVDLQGDRYADCPREGCKACEDGDRHHPEFEFEFEVVAGTEQETPGCIRVDFESGFSCGFPPEHEVVVDDNPGEVAS